jgi:hypothetical protein
VVVVDTGLADAPFLQAELNQVGGSGARDESDADDDGNLDPAAGHATFIAAIVGWLAPGATVEVRQVLSTFGDGSKSDVAATLRGLLTILPRSSISRSRATAKATRRRWQFATPSPSS